VSTPQSLDSISEDAS